MKLEQLKPYTISLNGYKWKSPEKQPNIIENQDLKLRN